MSKAAAPGPLAAAAVDVLNKVRGFAYAVLMPDLVVGQASPGFARLIGRPEESVVARPLRDILWEFVGAGEDLRAVLAGRRPEYRLEYVNRPQPDGSLLYLTFLVTPLDEDNPPAGLLLVVEDSTEMGILHQTLVQDRNELRLIRDQLSQANEELARLNRLKSVFLSMAAHDLRTPLTSIQGFSDLVRQGPVTEEQREYADIIWQQSGRLQRLIADLLALDQIEQGELRLRRRACALNDIVAEAVATLDVLAAQAGQTLRADLPQAPLTLAADPGRLAQIVYNLVGNALKYTPRDGAVTVRAYREGANVVLQVADTGRGLRPEEIDRLFTLYYQAAADETAPDGGAGVGLFVVKMLVEAHGGDVQVESRPDQGTTFTVQLPAG